MPFLFTRQQTGIVMLDINKIKPSKYQPRKTFAKGPLDELAQSIKTHGILQPLIVTEDSDGYMLIAGERRLRAARLAGLTSVPCTVTQRDERKCAELAIIENVQREGLSFFEEAEGYARLIEDFSLSQQEIAKRVGKKQSTISNKLRLLKLPPTARAIIVAAGLSERHARELLRISKKETLFFALDKIVEKKLNITQTEQFITSLLTPTAEKPQRFCKIGDIRIFINTLNKAVDMIKQSGIKPTTQLCEREGFVEYIIKIPKSS